MWNWLKSLGSWLFGHRAEGIAIAETVAPDKVKAAIAAEQAIEAAVKEIKK